MNSGEFRSRRDCCSILCEILQSKEVYIVFRDTSGKTIAELLNLLYCITCVSNSVACRGMEEGEVWLNLGHLDSGPLGQAEPLILLSSGLRQTPSLITRESAFRLERHFMASKFEVRGKSYSLSVKPSVP